jgi:hypothetical protein
MIKNFIFILLIGHILAEYLVLSEYEMKAIESSTYCADNGYQSWNFLLLKNLSAFLKTKSLSTVWIGPGPQWCIARGIEFVTLKDAKMSFGRTYDLNNETITKKTVCMKISNYPSSSNNVTDPLLPKGQIQEIENGANDKPNPVQEKQITHKTPKECCCTFI